MKQGQEKYWRGLKQKKKLIRAPHILMILLICSILLQFFPLKSTEANSVSYGCGLEEHHHTANCYQSGWMCKETSPCPYKDSPGDPGGNLYNNPVIADDGTIHYHTSACFSYLSCTENHEHTSSCYTQLTVDNCPKQEHTHDEKCGLKIEESKRDTSANARSSTDSTITNTVEGISPNNTVINLFDYWTFGSQDTTDCDSGFYEYNQQYYFNEGINKDRILKFRYTDFTSDNYDDGQALNINNYKSDGYPGIVEKKLVNGFPVIAQSNLSTSYTTEQRSLAYLFNEDTTTVPGKAVYSNVQNLLQVNSKGYYYYDSTENFAEYHEDSNSFSLFDGTGVHSTVAVERDGQFFPFNNYQTIKDSSCVDTNLNHYFGLTLTTRFIQDYDGMSDSASQIPMTFNFSGDDDVWVFIDDVLVGDVGGVHSKCTLSIDFSTGKVIVNGDEDGEASTTLWDAFEAAEATDSVAWNDEKEGIFANGTTHTLKFFYLERGNWDSNLSLTYNLNIVPETAIQKVDQYGNTVDDAEFSIYKAEASDYTDRSTYKYIGLQNEQEVTVSLEAARNGIVGQDGVITIEDENGEITISPVYQGTTGEGGKMVFSDSQKRSYSVSEIKQLIGDKNQFIMRETIVPDGYRKSSEEICLYFDGEYLQNPDPYSDGVWPSNSALVTATNTIYTVVGDHTEQVDYYTPASTSESNPTIQGTLFAVVLKRNGAELNLNSLNPFDGWVPLYGNDDVGYTVASANDYPDDDDYDPSSLSTIIEYAKLAQQYGSTVFIPTAGGMQATLTNLPGKITRYFTYMLDNDLLNSEEIDHDLDPQYVVAYFWTSATSLKDATESNTYRVVSHKGIVDNVGTSFSIKWGSTIEVPNFINRLYVQKRDTEGNPVNGASFSLYKVEPKASESGETIWYIADDGTTYFQLKDSGDQDNKGTATIKDDSNGTIYTYTISSEDGVIRLYEPGNSDVDAPNYTITPFKDAENEQVIVTKDNPLTSSSGSGSGDTSGDSSGSDSGTGDTGGGSDSSDSGSSGSSSTDTGSSSTDNVYTGVYSKGINYLTHIPDGYYILREVGVPSGFTLNTTETKIIVSENGVFANAGTSDDYVDVGNGVGYLTKTMDVFASSGSIDETLTWIYEVQRVNTAQTFSAFNLNNTVNYTAASSRASAGYGRNVTENGDISSAMVSYLVFDRENVNTLYDYRPSLVQSARTANGTGTYTDGSAGPVTFGENLKTDTANGEGTLCLYTDEGWTALEVYQDYGLGSTLTLSSTNYDDIQDRNISNLFSNSTFALYTDLVKVDLTILKTDDEENPSPLSGASFILYTLDENGNKTYYTQNGFVRYTDAEIRDFIREVKTGSAISAGNPVITSGNDGVLKFKNLTEGSYTLEEVVAPDNYALIDPQTVTVGPITSESDTEYLSITNYSAERLREGDYYDSTSANFQYLTTIQDTKNENKINVKLIKKNTNDQLLEGVEFSLYRIDSTGIVYYHYDENTGETTWTDANHSTELLTDSDGKILMNHLESGTYYLQETNTIDDYLPDTQVKSFKVSADTEGVVHLSSVMGRNISIEQEEGQDDYLVMVNLRMQDLPSTGGFGTWMLILAAVILIITGVLVRKKKNDDQDQENT